MVNNIKKIVKEIPNSSGCYKYFNKKGELIYIGKAKDLRKRVNSYFVGENDPKTKVLVNNIADIKWEVTDSEVEALVLESLLIKKYRPRFNIKIKDDKDFLWIKIDSKKRYPMPELVRRKNIQGSKKTIFFGPFTDSKLLKQGLSVLRKIFLWRDCSDAKFSFYQKKKKPCLEYYIKNCSAPCIFDNDFQIINNTNSERLSNNNDYQLGIGQLILFLRGKKKAILKVFEKEMKKYSSEKKFEKAALYRDRLRSLQHIDSGLRMEKVEEEKIKDLERFIDAININLGYGLEQKKDFKIEFYDISNISGKEATGSMVVSKGGFFNKNLYRKFKIKTVIGSDDYKMMEEVLLRRIKRIDWKLPDLIVLDGGRGQLSVIYRLFLEKGIKIPLLSLAKREEEIWGIANGNFKKTDIKKSSSEGFFIQRLRDEAHRFAIGYHKTLREKKTVLSKLDEVEGIGPIYKKKLLLKFGSVQGIIKASLGEIEEVVGKKLANKIKESI